MDLFWLEVQRIKLNKIKPKTKRNETKRMSKRAGSHFWQYKNC